MTEKYPTKDALMINWITSPVDDSKPYPSGPEINLSHCAKARCSWHLKPQKSGLYYTKCRICGSEAIIDTGGGNELTLPCRVT
jgi:hypothetical protein